MRTFYVSPAGMDTNNGISESCPWQHVPSTKGSNGLSAATILAPADKVIILETRKK